jgi:Nucleotidyl transferase AbiEii toxin, Type IV TA system
MSFQAQGRKITEGLKKLSKASGRDLNDLRLVMALERAIARLGRHPRLSEHLVFKGGFVLLKAIESERFTRDVDALAIGMSRSRVPPMVEHALKLDLDDGLWYGDVKTKDLTDQGPYGGFRSDCAFHIGEPPKEPAKIKKLSRIHIDVGFGDALDEVPRKESMRSILEESKPVSWSIYPMEYIFAEKLEALFSRGSANSRAKDVYDMPLIFPKCDLQTLKSAVKKTFELRGTPLPSSLKRAADELDPSVMKRSWGSVELNKKKPPFELSWKEFVSILALIDGSSG